MTMKRRIVLVLTLVLVLAALAFPARPVNACDWCMAITREQAERTCHAQRENYFSSCSILGGSTRYCMDRSWEIFDGCMTAHGF